MLSTLAIGLHRRTMWVLCAAMLAVGGCGGSEETETGATTTTTGGPDGGPPPVEGCPPGEVTEEDGSCRPPGIPDDGCAPGFEPDGRGGCDAVLPAEPCAEGQMALPGETACRDVAPCGAAKFGDVDDAPGTQYVDADYGGTDSDGSEAKPWTTIQEGVDAAGPGAVVAVAAGTYAPFHVEEAISVVGRCPSMVEVASPAGAEAVVLSGEGAILRGLGIRGDGFGLTSLAETATVDRCWIHDTAHVGVYAASGSLTLLDSLVEETGEVGLGGQGGGFSLERTVVRRTRSSAGGTLGIGVVVQPDIGQVVGSLSVKSSLIEDNSDHGILVVEGDATIDATLIRGTKPRPSDETFGRGLVILAEFRDEAPVLTLTRSVLEANHDAAIFVGAANAIIETTAIRDTLPIAGGVRGRGIEAQWLPTTGARASIDLRDSIIEECSSSGILLLASDATVAGAIIRGIHLEPSGQPSGRGLEAHAAEGAQPPQVHLRETLVEQCAQGLLSIGATVDVEHTAFRDNGVELPSQRGSGMVFQVDEETKIRSLATLRDSLLERHSYVSLTVNGSDVTVERTRVLETRPSADGFFGRGVLVQDSIETGETSRFVMVDSTVEHSIEAGMVVVDSEANLERVVIADTLPTAGGLLGDGLAVVTLAHPASARLVDSRIQRSARAGIGNFGASVTISKTVFECNAIHLDGEDYSGKSFSFLDEGGNACGCDGSETVCTVVSSMLEPPAASGP